VKKKRFLFALVALLLLGGLAWFALRREPPIDVQGHLSPRDIAEIKNLVRDEMRKEAFTGCSWRSPQRLPGAIQTFLKFQIKQIHATGPGRVEVLAAPFVDKNSSTTNVFNLKSSPAWALEERLVYQTSKGYTTCRVIMFIDHDVHDWPIMRATP
jgi:hypothetical protein